MPTLFRAQEIIAVRTSYHLPGTSRATLQNVLSAAAMLHALISPASASPQGALHKARQDVPIQHVVIIMQENRSFDSYFGTYPGANGIPPNVCLPLVQNNPQKGCVAPFHDQHDVNAGGPHTDADAQADADDGITTNYMDGFVYQQTDGLNRFCGSARYGVRAPENCGNSKAGALRHDVMGYHTAQELPNYWAYANNFVLQDSLFEGTRAWSLASHLDLVSEWSAICDGDKLSTCITDPTGRPVHHGDVPYPWVNLFQLCDLHGVSWKYYLATGEEPDCENGEMDCDPQVQASGVLTLWNPTPGFTYVAGQGREYLKAHNPPIDQFLKDIKDGTLPAVSWIVPSNDVSDHPPFGITAGQNYVTSLVNAVMQSAYWSNTAIFISWDDWGGFYDPVAPPVVDRNTTATPIQGFGFRVPGLMISAYAKPGYIDHAVLSLDNYAVLIEDLFMGGARLDPTELGEPDNRPDIRDELTSVTFPDGTNAPIGNLIDEFDFTQPPLPPLILSTETPTGLTVDCGSHTKGVPQDCTSDNVKLSWLTLTGKNVPGPFTYQVLRDGNPIAKCLTTSVACVDADVPAGTHYYTIYSVDPEGHQSPNSAGAEADVP